MLSMVMGRIFFQILCLLFVGSLVVVYRPMHVQAHVADYAAINTKLTVEEHNKIRLHTEIAKKVTITEHEIENNKIPQNIADKYYSNIFSTSLLVTVDNELCKFSLSFYQITEKRSTFNGLYECPKSIDKIDNLHIRNTLFSNKFTNYDHFVNLLIDDTNWNIVFNKVKINYPQDVPANKSNSSYTSIGSVAGDFTKLGVEHIWTGYDHLLFLVTAILLLKRLKNFLVVVTSFTVAHSITLALAAFNIITLPPKFIEPVIILTIILVAARNLFLLLKKRDSKMKERWGTAFGFGLIHGLGFAGALKEIGIPSQYFAPALGFFNIGIEVGQLAVLLFIVPILILLFKIEKRRLILSSVSVITILVAATLFIQRVLA